MSYHWAAPRPDRINGWNFRRRILGPIAAAALASVGLVVAAVLFVAKLNDDLSIARQVHTTERALSLSLALLARQQAFIVLESETVSPLNRAQPDAHWLDDHLGNPLHRLFDHDLVYLLDHRDRPVYAFEGGLRRAPSAYLRIANALMGEIGAVRDAAVGHSVHDRDAFASVPSSGRLQRSGLAMVLGRPAAVSVTRIASRTHILPHALRHEPLLVSVRFLDASFLDELAARTPIEAPRLSRTGQRIHAEVTLPLRSDQGRTIGYIHWRPDLPAKALLGELAPVVALSVALLLTAFIALGISLARAMGEVRLVFARLQRSIVELRDSEARSRHLANHDALTGLPNRNCFKARLSDALAHASAGEPVALLALDLDRFKHVNDRLGHPAGDALLCELARRLSKLVGGQGTIARLGGDEFAIILRQSTAMQAQALCDQILTSIGQPFALGGERANIGVSIGGACAPGDAIDGDALARKADAALYRAKRAGRHCYRFHAPRSSRQNGSNEFVRVIRAA